VVASPADVAKAYRQREFESRLGVGPTISEPVVSLMGATSRLSFLLEGIRAVRKWGEALWERLSGWFARVSHWVSTGGVPIYLDIAKLVQRALRVIPTVERKWHQVQSAVLGFGWVKKSSAKVVDILARHPLLDNAIHILSQFVPIFLKATAEECLKRVASPVFLVISLVEIVADALDVFYAEQFDREEVMSFIRDAIIRIIAHGLLTLVPLPVAIVLHTAVNCVQTWREKRVFSQLREVVLEAALDDFMEEHVMEPLIFHAMDVEWVPATVMVKEGNGMVPVKQRPELLEAARHQRFPTGKLLALKCKAAELLARPRKDLLSVCGIVKWRLEAPIPKPNRENIRIGYEVAKEYIFSHFRAVEPMSVADFRQYIIGQEFGLQKTKWYMERLDLLEKEVNPKVPVQPIVGKGDEVLPVRSDLGDDDTVKTRPIFPIDADQLDFMRWLLVWKHNFGRPFEMRREGHLFTFTYMLDSRADLLDTWINERCHQDGFHMLALGDDNIMMFVCHKRGWVGEKARFGAYDLATCDLTCGLDVQLCFVDLMRSGGLSETEAKKFLSRCKGLRELVVVGEPSDKRFFWEAKEVSTVTGNPATSIQAVFCQLLFVCLAWDQWVVGDAEDPEELGRLIHEAGTLNGHVLEWELDQGSVSRFSKVTRRTYLGGLFVPDGETLKWCPMSWLKTFCLFPDTQKIYGGSAHMEMHAAAISTDEGMLRTPIGSAFCALMRRLASAAGLTPPDFAEAKRLLHQSKSWYQRLKKTPYVLPPVEEGAFLLALQDLCFSRGFDDPVPEWKDLEAELLTVSSLPADLHSGGVRCLYHPRFGLPKVEFRKMDVFAALHKLAGMRDLPSYKQVQFFCMQHDRQEEQTDQAGQPAHASGAEQASEEASECRATSGQSEHGQSRCHGDCGRSAREGQEDCATEDQHAPEWRLSHCSSGVHSGSDSTECQSVTVQCGGQFAVQPWPGGNFPLVEQDRRELRILQVQQAEVLLRDGSALLTGGDSSVGCGLRRFGCCPADQTASSGLSRVGPCAPMAELLPHLSQGRSFQGEDLLCQNWCRACQHGHQAVRCGKSLRDQPGGDNGGSGDGRAVRGVRHHPDDAALRTVSDERDHDCSCGNGRKSTAERRGNWVDSDHPGSHSDDHVGFDHRPGVSCPGYLCKLGHTHAWNVRRLYPENLSGSRERFGRQRDRHHFHGNRRDGFVRCYREQCAGRDAAGGDSVDWSGDLSDW